MKIHFREAKQFDLNITRDERSDIYNWGDGNVFPSILEILINQSVTAKNAVDKASKAIMGKGVTGGEITINKKGHTLNDVIRSLSRQYTIFNNAFLSVGYNLLGEISSIEVIPSKNVRVGKRDDEGYNGKYVIYHNWDGHDGRVEAEAFQVIDRFNPRKEVVLSQIENAGGISKYKGQIIHIQKYMNEIYSKSDAHCVINDMLAEINASEFKQKGTSDGFLNTKILAVQPFNSDEERHAFKRDLEAVKGAKNANSVILLESPDAGAELEKQLMLQDLTSNHNDELFAYTEGSTERAIAKAFNVPIQLINPTDTGIFGNSGEMYKSIKQILWEEREEERMKIEEVLTKVMNNYKEPFEGRVDILQMRESNTTTNEPVTDSSRV